MIGVKLAVVVMSLVTHACARQSSPGDPSAVVVPQATTSFTQLVTKRVQASPVELPASRTPPATPVPIATATPVPTAEALPSTPPLPELAIPASTLVPIAPSAIQNCPITLPNLSSAEYSPVGVSAGYGNADRNMFIRLELGGLVWLTPGGADHPNPDGSVWVKFFFFRTLPGEVVFEGKRLDEADLPVRLATLRGPADGYGETGFHPAGLTFPSQGCWEVTARLQDAEMTFVTLVVLLPFKILTGVWLLDSEAHQAIDLQGYPDEILYIYEEVNGEGALVVGSSLSPWEVADALPSSGQRSMQVWGETGTCVKGAWDGSNWSLTTDATALMWSSEGIHHRISQSELGLRCIDLKYWAEAWRS
jgi:hypothetical protein